MKNNKIFHERSSFNFLLVITLSFLSSCTRSVLKFPEESFDPDENYRKVEEKSLSDARADIQKASLSCKTGACTDGVGLLVAVGQVTPERYFLKDACTVSIIKIIENNEKQLYALTAGHCIPKRLNPGSSCAEDIAIRLARGSVVKCESVVSVMDPTESTNSDSNLAQFDMALLKVKSDVEVSTFDYSDKPLKTTNPYQVRMLAIDPDQNWDTNLKAELRETQCWYMQGSYILPKSTQPDSPLFVTRECRLLPGNSGAPLLDGGAVVGIQSNFVRFKPKIFLDGSVTIASSLYCYDFNAKKMRCENTTPLKFADEEGDFYVPEYVKELQKQPRDSLDATTVAALKILNDTKTKIFLPKESLKGFSEKTTYQFMKGENSQYVRMALPACYYPQALKEPKQSVESIVLVYGLKLTERKKNPEQRLKLSLIHSSILLEYDIVSEGSGKFKILTDLAPKDYFEVTLPPCT